jgi:hypothetical protein
MPPSANKKLKAEKNTTEMEHIHHPFAINASEVPENVPKIATKLFKNCLNIETSLGF